LFLGKSTKTAATRAALFDSKCTKSFVGWGFAPDPTAGAYVVPSDPIAVFRGPTSKGREEGEGNRRGGEGEKRKGDEKRGERGGEGREGVRPLP